MPEEKRKDFLKVAGDAPDRMECLISDLLAVLSVEAGTLPLDRREIDVEELIRRPLAALEPRALSEAYVFRS